MCKISYLHQNCGSTLRAKLVSRVSENCVHHWRNTHKRLFLQPIKGSRKSYQSQNVRQVHGEDFGNGTKGGADGGEGKAFSDGQRIASRRNSDSGNCPPIEDESQYGQKVFGSRIGTPPPTELPEIFADSSVRILIYRNAGQRTANEAAVGCGKKSKHRVIREQKLLCVIFCKNGVKLKRLKYKCKLSLNQAHRDALRPLGK